MPGDCVLVLCDYSRSIHNILSIYLLLPFIHLHAQLDKHNYFFEILSRPAYFMLSNCISLASSAVLLLAALPLVTAHGDEDVHREMTMDMGSAYINMTSTSVAATTPDVPHNYFRYQGFAGWMYAHIVLMTIAWAVVLPVGKFDDRV